jgi:hypothetical protein
LCETAGTAIDMVDNSMSSQELISGSFFFHSTVITGYFILSVPAPTCFHLHQAVYSHFTERFLHSCTYVSAWHRRQRITQHFPRSPSSSGSSRSHRWCTMPVTLRRQLAPSFSRLHECYPEGSVGTHKMIICSPPFQVGQQLWGELRRGLSPTCQRCHAMTDREIHPLDKRSVESSREAHPLQGDCEICLCSQAHHLRDS